MSNTLRAKFETRKTTMVFLDALKEIFRQKNEQACIEITGKYTTKNEEKTPIRDHVIIMTNYFVEAELHDIDIDKVIQVKIILNFLSADFI